MTRTPQEVFAHHGQALLEWAADAAESRADGVDTFVFRDGLIQAETVHYTVQRKR
jgi:hypothetical protein